ncbi:hypothetical protein [Citrobacter amalonaticus]|uniref:hypothetical protein n=1 Tax=Citrobacter amalonaticus TaxID=35703 RepID=UPI000F67C333|nr:hypothetical protein [Citrobacter amalonaticus]RSC52129.1 hypothetical protein EGW07_25595 [Citrobacter amalonaticus]
MDQEMTFSLSYEQLLQETEESIRKCDLSKDGPHYPEELSRATDFLHLWYRLANRGCSGVGYDERIEADWKRLYLLVFKRGD